MSDASNIIELELYIIRHGQTYGNLGKAMEGFSDLDRNDVLLTDKGQYQAEKLGERFSNYPFDAVYASGLRRAMQTATEIIKRQPENGAENIIVHPLLSEVGGVEEEYSGLTFSQAEKVFPCISLAEGFDRNGRIISFTKGWSDKEQLERAEKVLSHIRSRYKNGAKVAVVAHAAFNTFLFHSALGLDPEKVIFDPHFLNTGVTKIVFFREGTGRYNIDVQLVYQNDLSHLYADYPDYGLEPCYF